MVAEKELLTPPQVAKKLRVSQETVIKWIRAGELAAIDLASKSSSRPRFRVAEDAIETFLQSRSVTTMPAQSRRKRESAASKSRFYSPGGKILKTED